jgi:hypothetical protein
VAGLPLALMAHGGPVGVDRVARMTGRAAEALPRAALVRVVGAVPPAGAPAALVGPVPVRAASHEVDRGAVVPVNPGPAVARVAPGAMPIVGRAGVETIVAATPALDGTSVGHVMIAAVTIGVDEMIGDVTIGVDEMIAAAARRRGARTPRRASRRCRVPSGGGAWLAGAPAS